MIAAVHLVWGPLGPRPLREFLASYRRYPGGCEHELVVLLNGVSEQQRPALMAELQGVEHRILELAQPVQDLVAYHQAAQRLEHRRVCFLNSYSEILAEDWLAKLDGALDEPGAALVGASGSWASVHSGVLHSLFLPSPYRGALPPRAVAREQFQGIELEQRAGVAVASAAAAADAPMPEPGAPARRSLAKSVVAILRTLPPMPAQLIRFQGFPAHHLRTNAFMVDRERFAALRVGKVARKMDAYALESGRSSFTRQIQHAGGRVLVVDRDGASFDQERWPLSRTLWQGDQEGLLIADNQTRLYTNGGIDRRRLLSALAWGSQADPRAAGAGVRP